MTLSSQTRHTALDILGRTPPWILRWGNIVFLGIVLLAIALSWYIKFPETISAPVTIIASEVPKPVVSRTTGAIVELYVEDKQQIMEGQRIACMASSAVPSQVFSLDSILTHLVLDTATDANSGILPALRSLRELGDLQSGASTLYQALLEYRFYLDGGVYERRRRALAQQLANVTELYGNLLEQTKLNEQIISLEEEASVRSKSLLAKKLISESDDSEQTKRLLGLKVGLRQIKSSLLENRNSQVVLRDNISTIDGNKSVQMARCQGELENLKNAIRAWELQYVVTAPSSGQVSFTTSLHKGDYAVQQQPIMYIVTGRIQYSGEAVVPQANSGKIEGGAKTRITLASYPPQEFGTLTGRVKSIATVPTRNGYLVTIDLTDGLKTNYGKQLDFREGMLGDVEIITKQMRLLERVFFWMKHVTTRLFE